MADARREPEARREEFRVQRFDGGDWRQGMAYMTAGEGVEAMRARKTGDPLRVVMITTTRSVIAQVEGLRK